MKSQKTAGVCRERWKGTTSMVHLLVQESSERGAGWLEAEAGGGTWRQVQGTKGGVEHSR